MRRIPLHNIPIKSQAARDFRRLRPETRDEKIDAFDYAALEQHIEQREEKK